MNYLIEHWTKKRKLEDRSDIEVMEGLLQHGKKKPNKSLKKEHERQIQEGKKND